MTPFADFLYFGVLLYIAAPSVIPGLAGRVRLSQFWILAATAIMLVVQYGTPVTLWNNAAVNEVLIVAAYALTEWLVAAGFLLVRQRMKHLHSRRGAVQVSRATYYAALAGALLPLALTKFTPLVAPEFVFGFLGISYVTFRSVDVVIGIQDGLIAELPIAQYLAFLLFFPTISSGPIDRYRRFAQDWKRKRTRAEFLQDLDGAVRRFFKGLLYKFIFAALIEQYWMNPVARGANLGDIASYMYAYSFYLFFDFAGYSNFAIALSYLLGVHTPENFNRPFFSQNIREFWDRWHISLSGWFRDHVYTRFVFAATKGKWFKSKYTASYLGFWLSMGLMGLWHGTAWYYLLYGFYHGTLLVLHDLFARWTKSRQVWGKGLLWRALSIIITFNLVCFSFLIFSGRLSAAALAPTPPPTRVAPASTVTPTLTPSPVPTKPRTPTPASSRAAPPTPMATKTRAPAR